MRVRRPCSIHFYVCVQDLAGFVQLVDHILVDGPPHGPRNGGPWIQLDGRYLDQRHSRQNDPAAGQDFRRRHVDTSPMAWA